MEDHIAKLYDIYGTESELFPLVIRQKIGTSMLDIIGEDPQDEYTPSQKQKILSKLYALLKDNDCVDEWKSYRNRVKESIDPNEKKADSATRVKIVDTFIETVKLELMKTTKVKTEPEPEPEKIKEEIKVDIDEGEEISEIMVTEQNEKPLVRKTKKELRSTKRVKLEANDKPVVIEDDAVMIPRSETPSPLITNTKVNPKKRPIITSDLRPIRKTHTIQSKEEREKRILELWS